MRACALWLHHQHTAEVNLLDRCRGKDDEYAAAAVAIGQLQLQLSHITSSLTGFLPPRNVTSKGASRGPQKFFSRLAIARHIFAPL